MDNRKLGDTPDYVPDEIWECPLLHRDIPEGLCVDIYEAMYGGLKKSAVPEVKDWEKVEKVCPGCPHYFEKS